MAITPNSYPFSGGAFMGGGGSPVNRDDIHTLNLTKNGESIGNYNPLIGDADVDVPSDAVVISFSMFSGAMPGSAYSKMASAVGAGQVVMLRSVSGASVVYWTLLAASVLSYKFISVSETAVLTVEIQTSGDSSGNHAFTISNVPLTELRLIDTGASSGDDRGHEHTRIAEALAAGKTVCIKYTSENNIAYGTLCGAHDGHYTFIVDYGGTPSVLTVIADGSMQISAIFDGDASEFSVTPDGTSTGYDITGATRLKVFLQKFMNLVGALKALAFKDKASYNDLSSGVQSSLDKADTALQSHQPVTDNNPTLNWNTTSNVGKVGSTNLRVTMPANPARTKNLNSTNFDDFVPAINEVVQYSINGSYTNGPSGAASSGYWGVLQVFWRNTYPYQLFFNSTKMWVRYTTTQTSGGWINWEAWTLINSNSIPSVINNLTSTSTTDALSAAQGKALNDNKASVSYWSNYSCRRTGMNSKGGNLANTRYKKILTISQTANENRSFVIIDAVIGGWDSSRKSHVKVFIANRQYEFFSIVAEKNYDENTCSFVLYRETDNSLTLYVTERNYYDWFINEIVWNDDNSVNYVYNGTESTPTGTLVTPNITRVVSIPLATGVGSPSTPVFVDSNGQVQPCTQGSTLKSNTATLYIAGYTDNNIPYYHVKDIKNGCVNHVNFSGITNSTCDITFEAPTLATGEEYDYVISLEGYTDNTGVSTGPSVENCKQVLHYDSVNNLWTVEPLFLQATDWRQICVVRGTTCEWKRVALS